MSRATWSSGHSSHNAAKSEASRARVLRAEGQENIAVMMLRMAAEYELQALAAVLNNPFPDEENIADFYKFAAIYMFELGKTQHAKMLLRAASRRDSPVRQRFELIGLLDDMARE